MSTAKRIDGNAKADWLKPGAVINDVNINRVEKTIDAEKKSQLAAGFEG